MILLHAKGVLSKEHGEIVVVTPDPKPICPEDKRALQDVLRGALYDVRRGRHQVPRALWGVVREQVAAAEECVLVEDACVAAWAEEEAATRAKLCLEARQRMDRFDRLYAPRGLALRQYQRVGIEWLAVRRAGLLTDEMGIGKTPQGLCAIPEGVGAIIVCPASLRGYWRDQILEWRPDLMPTILEGRGTFRFPYVGAREGGRVECVICSDAAMAGLAKQSLVYSWSVYLLADEAHMFKSETSARTQNMAALCAHIRKNQGWTIALTGTPLLNNPEELFQLAKVFGCHLLGWGSEPAYRRAFAMGPDMGFGPVYGAPKPAARAGLARISLRRTRAEVLPELPPKSYQYVPVTLPRALVKKLDAVEAKLGDKLSALEAALAAKRLDAPEWKWHEQMPTFENYAEVRKDLAKLKFEVAKEWVVAHEAEGLPTVVFAAHREPVDALAEREGWTSITGDTPTEERTARVKRFQQGEYKGIVGTIRAMGTGHTLTAASHALFIDRMFTPGDNSQAEDRVYRFGQKRAVLITILVGDHPLEKRLEKILLKKLELLDAAL